MATATSPTATSKDSSSIGVYLPDEFPAADVTAALKTSGCVPAFRHADPAEAVAACREHEPEVLLLGAGRADAEVLGLVGEVGEASAGTKVVLISKRSGNGEVRKALDAGVSGLVTLNEVPAALLPVIEVVRAGQLSVPGSRGGELEKQVLTSREKQILGLVVMGMTNAEIAAKLYLAESTVKSHLSSAFAKLGVASRSEAASVILDPRLGAGLGILTIPSS